MARSVIQVLQGGRGLAALAVVLHHAVAYSNTFTPGLPAWLQDVGGFGYLGVDFFFVLSGFIMAHIHQGDRGAAGYSRSRLVRVFLPYLPIGLGLAAIYTLVPGLSAGTRDWSWLASATLIPGTGEPALIVAWTLQFELLFYAIFGVSLAFRRPLLGVALWASAAVIYTIVDGPAGLAPFLDLIVIEFLFGMVAAKLVATLQYSFVASFIAFVAYLVAGATEDVRTVFALAAAFAIVGFVRMERRGELTVPTWLISIGGASYSIYLVHNPVTALAARLTDQWWIAVVTGAILGLAAGTAYHLLWERPLLKFAKVNRVRAPNKHIVITRRPDLDALSPRSNISEDGTAPKV